MSDTETTEQEAPPEPMRNLFENLVGALETNNTENIGQQIGNLFANMQRALDAPVEPGVNPMNNMLAGLFGQEVADRAIREVEVKTFFTARLLEGSMTEAIRITKEHFQLPDDYSIQIPLDISFKIDAVKAPEPIVD